MPRLEDSFWRRDDHIELELPHFEIGIEIDGWWRRERSTGRKVLYANKLYPNETNISVPSPHFAQRKPTHIW
jgi:hypothetical protein